MRHNASLWLIAAVALAPTLCVAQPAQLAINGTMEGQRGWSVQTGQEIAEPGHRGKALRVREGLAFQDILLPTQGAQYTCSAWVKIDAIDQATPSGMAYVAAYQYDQSGKLVEFADFAVERAAGDWRRHTYTFVAHPQTFLVSVRLGFFEAAGVAWFDDISLVRGAEAMDPEDGAAGAGAGSNRIAVLREPGLPAVGAGSDPDALTGYLRDAGLEAEAVSVAQLRDPGAFSSQRFAVLVLPYGRTFPLSAHQALVAYLKGGGDIVTLGGYPFENPVVEGEGGWVSAREAVERQVEEAKSRGSTLMPDPSFASAPEGWEPSTGQCTVADDGGRDGTRGVEVRIAPADAERHAIWHRSFTAAAGDDLLFFGSIRTEDIVGEGFGYMAVYQWDQDGKLVAFHDICHQRGTTDWQGFRYRFPVAAGTARVQVQLGIFRASGRAVFDNVAVVPAPPNAQINTSNGVPMDGLDVSSTQIGLCDPSIPLKRVARLESAPGQSVIPPGVSLDQSVEGWMATGVTGNDDARWVPLVYAYDRYGRPRGAVASMLNHYGGFYAGSTWVCFAAESVDLFSAERPEWVDALVGCVRHLLRGTYLVDVRTDQVLYGDAEPVTASVRWHNASAETRSATIRVAFIPDGSTEPAHTAEIDVGMDAFTVASVEVPFPHEALAGDFYTMEATLEVGAQPVDSVRGGFIVRRPEVMAQEPTLSFSGNYFTLNGRPTFLCGTDTYANVFSATNHTPLTWSADMGRMQDYGLLVYENLQFSPGEGGYPEERYQWLEGMMQLAHRHSQQYMAGLYIGADVAARAEVLAQQCAACRAVAERFRDVPGLIYYFNGDLRSTLDDTDDLTPRFREFLRAEYGAPEALREAWDADRAPASFEEVIFPPKTTGSWDDAALADQRRFEVQLTADWLSGLHHAVREVDSVGPTTAEFYRQPYGGVDVAAGIGDIDVSNIGYFDKPGRDIERLPAAIRFADRRATGKGVNLGEFGVKTHPAWTEANGAVDYHIVRTEDEASALFKAIGHYAFGMGASKIQSWCLDDSSERVFPWGLFYPNDRVPKDLACVYRNLGLLFRLPRPKYEPPALTVVLPDRHRLGPQDDVIHEALWRSLGALVDLHIDFNVIGEPALVRIPEATRAILYPIPYCPDDATYDRLVAFVRAGGALYVSGDIGYAPDRKRTRGNRVAELCGYDLADELYSNIAFDQAARQPARSIPGADIPAFDAAPHLDAPQGAVPDADTQVIASTADPDPLPVVLSHKLGKGTVFYVNDPIELSAQDHPEVLASIYSAFIRHADLTPVRITPDRPDVHAFRLPLEDGGAVLTAVNKGPADAVGIEDKGHRVALSMAQHGTGFAWLGPDGAVRGIEGQGECSVDGRRVMGGDCDAAVVSLDGKDIAESEALLVLPFGTGRLTVETSRKWRDRLVEVGEYEGGTWRRLEEIPSASGRIATTLDEDQAVSLLLICEKSARGRWVEWLNGMVNAPEALP